MRPAMRKSTALITAAAVGALAAFTRGVRQPGPPLPGDRLVRRAFLTRTIGARRRSGSWCRSTAARPLWQANGGTPSAREIIPELQRIAPGDALAGSTFGGPPFVVTQAVPPRALVTTLRSRLGRIRVSYVYVLDDDGHGGTMLSARLRMGGRPAALAMLLSPMLLVGHEVGQRVQFARLRRRVSAR